MRLAICNAKQKKGSKINLFSEGISYFKQILIPPNQVETISPGRPILSTIHSKSEQIGRGLLLSTEKLAEKVRISRRQYFGTKVC